MTSMIRPCHQEISYTKYIDKSTMSLLTRSAGHCSRSFLVRTKPFARHLNTMASTTGQGSASADSGKVNFPTDASLPGEYFEIRQTHPTGDYKPDPSKSLGLSPARQALVDDIIALYEMKPTVERVKRYTPDCVYNDQFVYANDRYKMAAQWFALPKLFAGAKSHGYQVVTNDRDLIQFRHEEVSKLVIRSAGSSLMEIDGPLRNGHSKSSPRPPSSTLLLACH